MKSSNIISINCGGRIFQTTPDTIGTCEMLTVQYNQIAEDQTLFLDKDPKVFSYVLEMMRGDMTFKETPNKIKKRLFVLLEFLLMRDMIKDEVWFRLNPDFKSSYCHTPTARTIRPSTSQCYFDVRKGSKINNFEITFEGSVDKAWLTLNLSISGRYLSEFAGIVNKNIFVFDVNIELLRDSEISLYTKINDPSKMCNLDFDFYVDKITMNGSN